MAPPSLLGPPEIKKPTPTPTPPQQASTTVPIWLHNNHPKTLACNIPSMADFGYFKDLPEILYRLLEGPDVRKIQKQEWRQRKGRKTGRRAGFKIGQPETLAPFQRNKKKPTNAKSSRNAGPSIPIHIRIQNEKREAEMEKENASIARKERRAAMAKKVIERYSHDPDYRFLYEGISDFFAGCLKTDMQHLNSSNTTKVSLAAKWCPSIDSSFDRSTLLCESIARKVFPRESYPEYEGIEEAHYAYRVRDRLRKEVLVPLRKVLELPEVYIGANRWDSIPYNRVASVAMKFYKKKFFKHDAERFRQYLEDVKAGKTKIAAGALLPHEIIESLNDDDGGEVAELQWKRIVDDLLQKGKMKNCIAVCDVSGSMSGTPMEVSVALGLLVSELCEEPWKGKLITFSQNPMLQMVEGDSLLQKTKFVRSIEWGMNTNFQKVFDLILQVAVNDYQVIARKFTEKGYGNVIPEIVFWNLRDSRATPVPGTQKGVALVSGFSKNLMKLFLDGDGEISPEAVMKEAIAGEEYQKLVVLD
ncbi:hypothetical protein D5086_007295 [Populus alba]|uniref:Uncharacterized protein n=1 Tax=Populus alba TaxID=43335 RepID=A0ACC4CP42_POPAL